ncbi:MAG TPA: ribosome recycling factor [Kiritimatiellia bacterium]|nr:ribosome recycling factor [Kiritimatiellia bacterium]
MESLDDILLETEDKMSKCVDHLQHELSGLRTGKASPSLVDSIQVEYYGAVTRLRDIAGISTPEPRLIVINPFDPSSLGAIDKAILAANVGITPISDGRVIRIPVPELSEERRKDLIKIGKRMSEEQRVAIRNVRRDANETIKTLQKNSSITEDERDSGTEDVQKLTDTYIAKIDQMIAAKEKDILEV